LHSDIKPSFQSGYILPSLLGLLSLVSLASLTAFQRSATDIQILQAEKNVVHAFSQAENHLLIAEQALLNGVWRTDLVEIEVLQSKNFRKRVGIDSTHYQLTATEYLHQTVVEIQVTIRIHEKNPSQKKSNASSPSDTTHFERITWQIL